MMNLVPPHGLFDGFPLGDQLATVRICAEQQILEQIYREVHPFPMSSISMLDESNIMICGLPQAVQWTEVDVRARIQALMSTKVVPMVSFLPVNLTQKKLAKNQSKEVREHVTLIDGVSYVTIDDDEIPNKGKDINGNIVPDHPVYNSTVNGEVPLSAQTIPSGTSESVQGTTTTAVIVVDKPARIVPDHPVYNSTVNGEVPLSAQTIPSGTSESVQGTATTAVIVVDKPARVAHRVKEGPGANGAEKSRPIKVLTATTLSGGNSGEVNIDATGTPTTAHKTQNRKRTNGQLVANKEKAKKVFTQRLNVMNLTIVEEKGKKSSTRKSRSKVPQKKVVESAEANNEKPNPKETGNQSIAPPSAGLVPSKPIVPKGVEVNGNQSVSLSTVLVPPTSIIPTKEVKGSATTPIHIFVKANVRGSRKSERADSTSVWDQ